MPESLLLLFSDGFPSPTREFHALDALDVVLRKDGCRTAYRTEVEAAVLLARIGHYLTAVSLANIIMEPPCSGQSTYGSIRLAVVGPMEPQAMPAGVLAGPA